MIFGEASGIIRKLWGRCFVVTGAGIFSVLLVIVRTTVGSDKGGDMAVWLFVHEWIDRGATLYSGVWDHKDWGFFAITGLFYHFAGTTGLYFSGLIASLLFATGTLLSVRQVANWYRASLVASIATAIYVLSPSFRSTYTENYAIAFAVLGVGLLSRSPFSAGAVFAMSAVTKISGLPLFLCVLLVFALLGLNKFRRNFSGRLKTCLRSISGFIVAGTVFVFVAAVQGSLSGWIDVITYNFEYSAIRRSNRPSSLIARPPLDSLLPIAVFMTVIIAAAVCISVFLILQSRKMELEEKSLGDVQCLMLNGALVVGSAIVLSTQYPPSFQHYQYLVGPAVSTLAVLVAMIWGSPYVINGKSAKFLVLVSLAPLLVGGAIAGRVDGLGFVRTGFSQWRHLNRNSQVVVSLDQIPPDSSLTFIDVGGWHVNLHSVPKDATLSCPFFFQLPHLLPRYGQEIISCLQSEPDFVIVRLNDYTDQDFRNKVREVLANQFVSCVTEDSIFKLWSRQAADCPERQVFKG